MVNRRQVSRSILTKRLFNVGHILEKGVSMQHSFEELKQTKEDFNR